MNVTRLEQLAREGFTRVPVVRRLLADLETPLGAYLKFAGPFSFLFESVEGGEKWGRYSIIGLPCRRRLVVRGTRITLCDGDAEQDVAHADPLAFVEEFLARERALPHEDLPMFAGGLVGYFGYDCVRMVEPRLAASAPPDVLGTPDILLMVAEEFLVFDNLAGAIALVVTVDPREADAAAGAEARLDALQQRLEGPAPRLPPVDIDAGRRDSQRVRDVEAAFESEFGRERFEAAVERMPSEYILAGDVMQVVLSQRSERCRSAPSARSLPRSAHPQSLALHVLTSTSAISRSWAPRRRSWCACRTARSPCARSPARAARRHARGGPRARTAELLADPKERAEHLMLIDLGRNDVGRVARSAACGDRAHGRRALLARDAHRLQRRRAACARA
jgi:anthranilate synthase component 1